MDISGGPLVQSGIELQYSTHYISIMLLSMDNREGYEEPHSQLEGPAEAVKPGLYTCKMYVCSHYIHTQP